VAEYGLQWPPTVPVTGEGRIDTASASLDAILRKVEWVNDPHETVPSIEVKLEHTGRSLLTAVACPPEKESAYRVLYAALQRGRDRTLAAINDFEVEPPPSR
jgi:hypothetical protein